MTPEQGKLVRYPLARAMESLDEARLLFTNGHVRTAVNRIHYACFDAVSAPWLTEGKSSPRHSGVRSHFDQSWIATERLPKDMGRFYRRLFDSRQTGDYDDLASFGRSTSNRAAVPGLRVQVGAGGVVHEHGELTGDAALYRKGSKSFRTGPPASPPRPPMIGGESFYQRA